METAKNLNPKKNSSLVTVIVVVGILVALVLSLSFYKGRQNGLRYSATNKQTANSVSSGNSSAKIAMSEVAKHNDQNSCWTVIDGEVFDLTKFVPMHKGGDVILQTCGTDGTDLFTGKSPMGRMHSQMARKLLQSMKVGTI